MMPECRELARPLAPARAVVKYAIVARDSATVASTVTYLLPVVAIALDGPSTSTV